MLVEANDPDFGLQLETLLLESLRNESTQSTNSVVQLVEKTVEGRILAGFSGTTSYGWLHINMVWVDPKVRREGHARRLLERAVAIARTRDCHAAWLDTSSPSAFLAWQRLGFVVFGQLENAPGRPPERHRRWFLRYSFA